VSRRLFHDRGGACPSATDAIAGVGSGGTLVERRSGRRDELEAFGSIEEGDYVVLAIGRNSACVASQYGCTAFTAGVASEVVLAIGDSGSTDGDCGAGTRCDAGLCVPDPTECEDLALFEPGGCTTPADCGPTHAFDCTANSCVPKNPDATPVPIGLTQRASAPVIGDRFSLVAEDESFVHVFAAVGTGGSASTVRRWSAPQSDLTSGNNVTPDTEWMLDRPFAVVATDRAPVGEDEDVHATVYHRLDPNAVTVGVLDEDGYEEVHPIYDIRPCTGTPAYTGFGADTRQFWICTSAAGLPELSSTSFSGLGDATRAFESTSVSSDPLNAEIVGSRGDYALVPSSTAGSWFFAYSDPPANGGTMRAPMAEPQLEVLDGIEGRPAFVHLFDDEFVLFYSTGPTLVMRSATCTPRASCVFSGESPAPLPIGSELSLLRGEALYDRRTYAGIALAFARTGCGGSSTVDLLILDTSLRPVFHREIESVRAADVELAIVDDGASWRLFVGSLHEHPERMQDVSIAAIEL
jgi:hypothetical protein